MKRIALLFLCLLPCVSGLSRAVSAPLVPMVASPVTSHVLWTNANGQISLWNYHDDGTYTYNVYGPYPGWTAKTISDGPDGRQRVLWVCTDGSVSLWSLDNTTGAFTHAEFGPYPGWTATTLSTASSGGGVGGAAGGDLFGFYPNPTIAPNAIDHTKLASDMASLNQVSGGQLTASTDGVSVSKSLGISDHLYVTNWGGFGGGISTQFVELNGISQSINGGLGRALINDGSQLVVNYANDFGAVTIGSDTTVLGHFVVKGPVDTTGYISTASTMYCNGLQLVGGDINAPNNINCHFISSTDNIYSATGLIAGVGIISKGFIHADGAIDANSLQLNGGSDLAEPYKIAPAAELQPAPGLVVSIDPAHTGQMRVTTHAYDDTVGGIISGANGIQPGIVLRQAGTIADGTLPIASAGRVWCWCDADAGGAISPGNLLTTSDTPGHAMRVRDHDRARGAIIGKAMSSLPSGKGLVLVLVTLE